jgi:hypothetical protein
MIKTRSSLFLWILLLPLAVSCSDDSTPAPEPADGSTVDSPSSPSDSSTPDGSSPESSTVDSPATDDGATDGGSESNTSTDAADGPVSDGPSEAAVRDGEAGSEAAPLVDAAPDVMLGD